MKRYMPLISLTLLVLLSAGCEVFPYVTQPTATISPPPATATTEATSLPPTETLAPSPTPTATPEETAGPLEAPSYTLQEGSPAALPNFNHPEAGCDWLGVAGQVFNAEGLEVLGLTVQVFDEQGPDAGPYQAQTGDALAYGRGGYEIQVAEQAFETSMRFSIQVFTPEGTPLTERLFFSTYGDCSRNLILINFVPRADDSTAKEAPTPGPTTPAYP